MPSLPNWILLFIYNYNKSNTLRCWNICGYRSYSMY